MDDWKYKPAGDLGMPQRERMRSLRRETGLVGLITHNCWWWAVRTYLGVFHRLTVSGLENLPTQMPFVLVANHSSHLDALVMGSMLPTKFRNAVFPIAAGDFFFETPVMTAFSAWMMNALPMWRKNAGRHAMQQLRERLVDEPCGYILFPEGTRTRTGEIGAFHAGIGMLVAGTQVPVIPCRIGGAFQAWPASSKYPKPGRLSLRIGKAMTFEKHQNNREAWDGITTQLTESVRAL